MEGRVEGREEGREEGRVEGREEGHVEGTAAVAREVRRWGTLYPVPLVAEEARWWGAGPCTLYPRVRMRLRVPDSWMVRAVADL